MVPLGGFAGEAQPVKRVRGRRTAPLSNPEPLAAKGVIMVKTNLKATLPVIHVLEENGFAGVIAKKSVRLFGKTESYDYGAKAMVEVPYDKTFKIGDHATYDSYNLTYIGVIVGVGTKTVTIDPGHGDRKRRLKLSEFGWRNREFNLEETRLKNSEELRYI